MKSASEPPQLRSDEQSGLNLVLKAPFTSGTDLSIELQLVCISPGLSLNSIPILFQLLGWQLS